MDSSISTYKDNTLEIDFPKLHEVLNLKVAPVKVMGISGRLVNYWMDQKILPDDRGIIAKNRYFSYLELFWAGITVELRKLGYSTKQIAKIMPAFFVRKVMDKRIGKSILFIEQIAYDMLIENKPKYLLVSHDGWITICDDQQLSTVFIEEGFNSRIVVCLHSIFRKYITGIRFDTIYKKYLNLNESEQKVLDAIYNNKTKEIRVRYKRKDAYIVKKFQMVVTEYEIVTILKNKRYYTITISYNDGSSEVIRRL